MQAIRVIYLWFMWINKLQPMGALASAGQMGQHSRDGMMRLAHSLISSQIISSHRTAPLSHTQIRHGSGFHTSLSLYCWPSWMQPPASSVVVASRGVAGKGGGGRGGRSREVGSRQSETGRGVGVDEVLWVVIVVLLKKRERSGSKRM